MTNISKNIALVAFFGLAATAAPADAETEGACPTLAWVTVDGTQVQLPFDVAKNVETLQGYGTRYARAVALIVEENGRPDWTFVADCPSAGVDVVAAE